MPTTPSEPGTSQDPGGAGTTEDGTTEEPKRDGKQQSFVGSVFMGENEKQRLNQVKHRGRKNKPLPPPLPLPAPGTKPDPEHSLDDAPTDNAPLSVFMDNERETSVFMGVKEKKKHKPSNSKTPEPGEPGDPGDPGDAANPSKPAKKPQDCSTQRSASLKLANPPKEQTPAQHRVPKEEEEEKRAGGFLGFSGVEWIYWILLYIIIHSITAGLFFGVYNLWAFATGLQAPGINATFLIPHNKSFLRGQPGLNVVPSHDKKLEAISIFVGPASETAEGAPCKNCEHIAEMQAFAQAKEAHVGRFEEYESCSCDPEGIGHDYCSFGFHTGERPCFVVKVNSVIGWTPPPPHDQSHITLSCYTYCGAEADGKETGWSKEGNDTSLIGGEGGPDAWDVFPRAGIPSARFHFANQPDYDQPFFMIRPRPSFGPIPDKAVVEMSIHCHLAAVQPFTPSCINSTCTENLENKVGDKKYPDEVASIHIRLVSHAPSLLPSALLLIFVLLSYS